MINNDLKEFAAIPYSERNYSYYLAAANALRKLEPADTKLPVLKLAILRNYTIEPLLAVFETMIYFSGFHAQVFIGDFDDIAGNAFDENSALYAFKPDFIFLTTWLEALSPALTTRYLTQSKEQIESEVIRIRAFLADIEKAVRRYTQASLLVNNFIPYVEPTLGILDSQIDNSHIETLSRLNRSILLDAKETADVYIVNWARIATAYGVYNCYDQKHWHMARAPWAPKAIIPAALEVVKFVNALRGKAKKCLVLDCDNTLWGGIIGEDGMSGIKLGASYPGSCYLALQEEILNLHERGVILAMCSKNNEADVLRVLRDHPDMLLREKHFATWRINWEDKVTNLNNIVSELNIGLDSLVFVDDSQFEIDFVRKYLPQVATLHLQGNTSEYRSILSRAGYFDSLTFTAEDRRKNEMYIEGRQRHQLEKASGSLEEYLQNLRIEVEIGIPDEFEITRVSQLTQKTNQFNLTTRRYSEWQIREFINDDRMDVFYLKVKDKISDSGIVGVAIMRYNGLCAEIDSFLLSCRVIGRGIEIALLAHLISHAKVKKGMNEIRGHYLASEKNTHVKDFYAKNAFELLDKTADSSDWLFNLKTKTLAAPAWITAKTTKM